MNKFTPLFLIALSVYTTSPLMSGHKKGAKRPTKEQINIGYNQNITIKNGKLDLSYRNLVFDYYNSLSLFKTIVDESHNLKSPITHLDLTGNKIETLPDCIGRLTSLQSLNLSSNPLQSLPCSITQLSKLRLLILPDGKKAKTQ